MPKKKVRKKASRKKPWFWHPTKDALSPSTIAKWLACKEQFRLEVVEAWAPKYVPIFFEFGTAVHWTLQQAYKQDRVPKAEEWLKWVSAYADLWKSQHGRVTSKQQDMMEHIYGLLEILLPVYGIRWAGDWPKGKYPVPTDVAKPSKWLGLEQRFRVDFDFEDSTVWPLRGIYDGIFRTKQKEVWVFDTKCYSVIKPDEILDTMPHSLQFWMYLWASMKQGYDPVGFLLNVVRRPGHQVHKKESKSAFFKRVGKEIADESNWDHWFQRYEMQVVKGEIVEWETKFLEPVLTEIRMWVEGKLPHYVNPEALTSKYGKCAMFEPITRGTFTGCYRRR